MSQVRSDIDLAGLARSETQLPPPRRSLLRVLVPLAILLAFAAVLLSTLGDLWKGSIEVGVVRPRTVDASSSAAAGVALFQAAGWVEPEPFATDVTALASGVVREMLVQPSDVVAEGDVVAVLISADAELAVAAARAALARAEAELELAQADAKAARTSFEHALAVVQAFDVARAELVGREAEADHRGQAALASEARVTVAVEEIAVQRALADAGAAGPRQVELAEARVAEARAELAVARADAALAAASVDKARADLERAKQDRELRIEDRQLVETSEARVAIARAEVAAARASLDEAELRLERMEVRSPIAGVVLERVAGPGSSLGDGGAVVCTLYDPRAIRVRVDVPQGDVGKVGVGMKAEVLAESRPGKPYHGEVIRLVHKADIQKVTLQVHVRIDDGDALLRPEMLVQARFLASGAAESASATAGSTRVLVPARLIVDESSIWVVDGARRTATLRRIELGARHGDEVEVRQGINVSDKLIDAGRERVTEGARLTLRGE